MESILKGEGVIGFRFGLVFLLVLPGLDSGLLSGAPKDLVFIHFLNPAKHNR